MPKYKLKSCVKRGRELNNYLRLRKQQHRFLEFEVPQSTSSSLSLETHDLSSMDKEQPIIQVEKKEAEEIEKELEEHSGNATLTVDPNGWQDARVCRVCFVTDCNLYSMIVHRKLANAYKIMTGLSVLKKDFLPPYLCAECATRLMNSASFRSRSLQAHNTLMNLLNRHSQVTVEGIKSTFRKRRVGTNLIRTNTLNNHYDLKIDHEKEMEKIANNIKMENNCIDDNNGNDAMECESKDEEDRINAQDPLNVDNRADNVVIEIKMEKDTDISNEQLHFTDLDENTATLDLNRSIINRTITNDIAINNVLDTTNRTPVLHENVSENIVVTTSDPVLPAHVPDPQKPSVSCEVMLDDNGTIILRNVKLGEMGR